MKLEQENFDQQVRRLKAIFKSKSKLKKFLIWFGVKNYQLHQQGNLVYNNPSIKWFANQLKQIGISNNYWGIRKHLYGLAKLGVFIHKKVIRPVDNSIGNIKRITQVECCEFYLNPKLYPAIRHILTTQPTNELPMEIKKNLQRNK
jgi:hypothetical protein